MSDKLNTMFTTSIKSQQDVQDLVGKLFSVLEPGAVFSEPVRAGDYTVITASEVTVGLGYGYGLGGSELEASDEAADPEEAAAPEFSGGGGGGHAMGRPLASIVIGPKGVEVEPIVDVTKIAIAFFTAFGSVLLMLIKMRGTVKMSAK